jgi:hypothetical protein
MRYALYKEPEQGLQYQVQDATNDRVGMHEVSNVSAVRSPGSDCAFDTHRDCSFSISHGTSIRRAGHRVNERARILAGRSTGRCARGHRTSSRPRRGVATTDDDLSRACGLISGPRTDASIPIRPSGLR